MTKQYIISSFPSLHMTEMLTYFIIIRKTCFTNKGKTAKHGDSNITLAIITKLYFLRTFFSLGINKITLSLFSIFPQRLYLKMNFPWSHSEIWVLYLEKREKIKCWGVWIFPCSRLHERNPSKCLTDWTSQPHPTSWHSLWHRGI